MSLLDGLAYTLAEMGLVQLSLVFLAVATYSVAINGSFGSNARSGAASLSFVAAVAFSALTPSWMSAVVFLALAVAAVAAFAAAAWLESALLGLGAERNVLAGADEAAATPTPAAQGVPVLARIVRSL